MINMFLTNGMYLSFCFLFISCPEPPMGISGVVSFPAQSGVSFSNYFSSSLVVAICSFE